MKLINDDILSNINPDIVTVVLHGANCQNIMGAGIARYLRDKFPAIYIEDCKTKKGDINKLGKFSFARIDKSLFIFNLYTQFNINKERDVDYEAVYNSLLKIKKMTDKHMSKGLKIEIRSPQIGCGLAGGEWSIVEKMFDHLLPEAKIYYI